MSPTHLSSSYPEFFGPLGRTQMLLTVGIGAVLLTEVVLFELVVAGQGLTVVLVVALCPPVGGFLLTQSLLLHLPPKQVAPQ